MSVTHRTVRTPILRSIQRWSANFARKSTWKGHRGSILSSISQSGSTGSDNAGTLLLTGGSDDKLRVGSGN